MTPTMMVTNVSLFVISPPILFDQPSLHSNFVEALTRGTGSRENGSPTIQVTVFPIIGILHGNGKCRPASSFRSRRRR